MSDTEKPKWSVPEELKNEEMKAYSLAHKIIRIFYADVRREDLYNSKIMDQYIEKCKEEKLKSIDMNINDKFHIVSYGNGVANKKEKREYYMKEYEEFVNDANELLELSKKLESYIPLLEKDE